jgi:hypothetical protein
MIRVETATFYDIFIEIGSPIAHEVLPICLNLVRFPVEEVWFRMCSH